jgi:hypothetical protein
MVLIAGDQFDNDFEPEPPFPAQMRFFSDDERLISSEQFEGKRHALLISGGRDKDTNNFCFWGNIAFTFRTLVYYYGWDKSDIQVCMSDGGDPADDRKFKYGYYSSSPLDLDGDQIPDYNTPADRGSVISALDNMVSTVEPDDMVFIFITNHGTRPPGWMNEEEVGVCLWGPNPENNLWDYELADYLDQLPNDAIKIVSVFSCFAGGFIDEIEDNGTENVVICTPCRADESIGMGRYMMDTAHDWVAALNWATEDIYHCSDPVDADSDENGLCEIDEAFDFMVRNYSGEATPQWYDTNNIGEITTLYGNPNGPILVLDSIDNYDDVPYGDGDGYFERGEEVAIYVSLMNAGQCIAENVHIEISSNDIDISIISGGAEFPDISPGESATNLTPLVFGINDSLSYNKIINTDMEYSCNGLFPVQRNGVIPVVCDSENIGFFDDLERETLAWAEYGTTEWCLQDTSWYSYSHAWRCNVIENDVYVNTALQTPLVILNSGITDNKLTFYSQRYCLLPGDVLFVAVNAGGGWETLASFPVQYPPNMAMETVDLNEYSDKAIVLRFNVLAPFRQADISLDNISIGSLSDLGNLFAWSEINNVTLWWEYTGDDNVLGFNLYRREISPTKLAKSSGLGNPYWTKINDCLIIGTQAFIFVDTKVIPDVEYEYRLEAILPFGYINCRYLKHMHVYVDPEDEEEVIPKTYVLKQNYPNPSSGITTINFGLPKRTSVSLAAYDLKGRCVARLIDDRIMLAGIYSADFDTSSLSDGIYLYRLTTPDYTGTKKLVVKH